ncbi:MAG TPA: hypothetical protein VF352_00765 [Anaerolineales bacterium]
MKIIRTALHYWFAIVSVLSFLVGWGMLAHSLKPVQPAQTTTLNTASLPALPPIQAFGGGNRNGGSGLNFSAPSNQSNFGFPILRSGGS